MTDVCGDYLYLAENIHTIEWCSFGSASHMYHLIVLSVLKRMRYAFCVHSFNFNEKMNEQFLMRVENFRNQKLKIILIEILHYFIDSFIAKD